MLLEVLLGAILLITCLCIFTQDLKSRAVSVFLFPIIAVIGILYNVTATNNFKLYIFHLAINNLILIIHFLILKLFFRIKNGNNISIINEKIGLGDLYFFVATSFFFETIVFIHFQISTLIISLIIHIILRKLKSSTYQTESIPLAGFQAMCLCAFILFKKYQ